MIIKYSNLNSTDFVFKDISAYRLKPELEDYYNCETVARTKHLLFYQYKNRRCYDRNNKHLFTLDRGDIVFIPHGTKYTSYSEDKGNLSSGVGISFYLTTPGGEEILFDEDLAVLTNDKDNFYYKYFEKVLFAVINPSRNILSLKSALYFITDNIFSESRKHDNIQNNFISIEEAIRLIEKHPEKNISTKELADLCFMSEASFLRKFKAYSGGIPPIKYRNNIRLMLAEELSASPLTTAEIAERLGFYDSAHLCRAYKEVFSRTLKKKV